MLCSILVHMLGDSGGHDCPEEHTLCVGCVRRAGVTAVGPGHLLGLHACLEVSGVH